MNKFFLLVIIAFSQNVFSQNKLIKYEKVETVSKKQLKEIWKKNSIPGFITPVKNGFDLYELYYYTNLPSGKEVVATGLYYVPLTNDNDIPTLLYNHGTVTQNRKGTDYNGESTICKLFAADGYAVAWQDYIGLGKAEGFHPYQHYESTGQSGVDLLKAIREINRDIKFYVNQDLFISGYSQGGYSTLAVHKMIQEKFSTVFKVRASSPMSGAYDMAGVQSEVMEIEYTQPHYLPYLLYGYNEIYNIVEGDFEQIFKPPYDSIIPLYFDKQHNVGEINSILPKIPIDMIAPYYADQYRNNPDFPFTKHLQNNNLYDWVPDAPVQLCYCKGDEEVYYKNSIVAYDNMVRNGAKYVTKRSVGDHFTHRQCADYAALYTKFYFDSFRNGAKNGSKGAAFKNMIVSLVKGMRKN